ncbi:hypothetical protein KFL_012570010 [Klebsormidium nitens]|uniref:Uncharacterized protein n=1 Tax=Klebsormidium nitens TaxID=105231 RepID=A0A1Y1IQ21_KLENI|nr:hypothetical protein KFL_012570010 [Klebsormidium nitens]|eukprot:GAQ93025.1 hypothetical protein KFL_012570010 [Klebsormidium nitens]
MTQTGVRSPGDGFCPTSWTQVSSGRFIIDPRLLVVNSTAFNGWVGPPEVWFDRTAEPTGSWRQQKILAGDEVIRLQTLDAKSREAAGGKRSKSAAESALNRGRQAGEIPRTVQQKDCGREEEGRDANGQLTLVAQAARFLANIKTGYCSIYSTGETEGCSPVFLMTTWNHNAARPKPLGRPSKSTALLETGPRVVEAPCSTLGQRVFGVFWNTSSPSPERTMVHFDAEADFQWYCEGRRGGCSKTADCRHLLEVKRVLERREGVSKLEGCLFTETQLERARVWLQRKKREVAAGKEEAACTQTQAGEGCQASKACGEDLEALSDEERYLLGLVAGERHDATAPEAVHDPPVTLLKQPVRVSQLTARDFDELSRMECLCAPCPKEPPPCGTGWSSLVQASHIYSLDWSQEVQIRIYCCNCPEKHTVHFNGETLGLYVWTRSVIVTQASCQLLLRCVQGSGSAYGALIEAKNAVRRFICGPHPAVLLCDGIAGLACADGGRQKGGLSGTSAAHLRPFTAPTQDAAGVNVEKVMQPGVNFCAAGLDGCGPKRRLLHQPELRTLLARFSRHHPKDPDLGAPLSSNEFDELMIALDRADVQVVTEFISDPNDPDADPVLLHWRRRLLLEQTGLIRTKNRALLVLMEGIKAESLLSIPGQSPPRCPGRWSELLYSLGTPKSVSDDSNVIQHGSALAVVRKLLLGGVANLDDRAVLAEHSPILRRLLDHYGSTFPTFFLPTLHHLYRLTLFGRGTVGLGVGRAGIALSAIEGLDICVWSTRDRVERPHAWSADRQQAFAFWEARANALLPAVEQLSQPEAGVYPLSVPETALWNGRLGLEAGGSIPPNLPLDHPFCKEQRLLGCYPLLGWEQKRPLPQYRPFEDELGRSIERAEEHRCRGGLTVGEFDAEVATLSKSKSAQRLQRHTKGGFVFCCPHRVIYGFHAMLRGESPRDPFAVLYTRLHRHNLPRFVFYDNACKLRAYCMRREPAFFADVRFLVDRFHFQRTGAEGHKCGPTFNPDYYDVVRWVNTSAVESCNSFLVRFKTLGWYSGLEAFMIILASLIYP